MSEMVAIYKLYDKVVLTSSLEELEHYNAILELRLLDDGQVRLKEIPYPVYLGETQIDQLIEVFKLLKRQINELHQPTE